MVTRIYPSRYSITTVAVHHHVRTAPSLWRINVYNDDYYYRAFYYDSRYDWINIAKDQQIWRMLRFRRETR